MFDGIKIIIFYFISYLNSKQLVQGKMTNYTIPREKRKQQTCSFCKNHGLTKVKRGHKPECEYRLCECDDCLSTKLRQTSSAIEKKNHYNKGKDCEVKVEQLVGRQRKVQKCRKCMNHGKFDSLMRDHKKTCEWKDCSCPECKSTLQRRKSVRSEAKNKREKEKKKDQQKELIIKTEVFEMPMEIQGMQIEDPVTFFENQNSSDNGYMSQDEFFYHQYYGEITSSSNSAMSPTNSHSSYESYSSDSIVSDITNLTLNPVFDNYSNGEITSSPASYDSGMSPTYSYSSYESYSLNDEHLNIEKFDNIISETNNIKELPILCVI